jgi:hypothetical protein
MKKIIAVFLFTIGALTVSAQNKTVKKAIPDPSKPVIAAEASCGKCQLGLKSKDCDLAVRINGKSYFVDGVHIDSLGDAHAKDGMCNAIRKAHMQGEVVNDRFKATYFVLDPMEKKNK